MKRLMLLLAVACALLAGVSPAGAQTCPEGTDLPKLFEPGTPIRAQGKFDRVEFLGLTGTVPDGLAGVHALPMELTEAQVRYMRALQPAPSVVFTSSTAPELRCAGTAGFAPPMDPGSGAGSGAGGTAEDWSVFKLETGDCVVAGTVLSHRISKETNGNFTALIFDPATRDICYRSTDRPAYGAAIHVAILTDEPSKWIESRLTYSPCSLEESRPSLFIPENLPAAAGFQAEEWYLRRFQSRRCYDPSVTVTVERVPPAGSPDPAIVMRAEISQARRYHAALQVGVLFTNVHDHEFGLAKVGDTTRVLDKGPVRNGPEYIASLVVYSVLQQLGSIAGGARYPGRDLVGDNRVQDRISGILGVGLSKPADRFVVGVGYEVVTGVNTSLTWNWARVRRLTGGLEAGSPFTGTEAQLPVRRQWVQDAAFGISFDLTYATKLLSR